MEKTIKIIKQEIEFHKGYRGEEEGPRDDWGKGFIRGLEHIYKLLQRVNREDTDQQAGA
jgi:hypothetical protein